jgi:3-deoxy-manno-octulosonate cytidylyltransferase (CMP-KDO synthetase)
MIENENTAIIISTHMGSTTLPGAAMADLWGEPMVVRTWRTAKNANIGEVLVAAPSLSVVEAVQKAGGDAIVINKMTTRPLAQAAEALGLRDPAEQFSHVLVIPANYPLLTSLTLRRCLAALNNPGVDFATVAGTPPPDEWQQASANQYRVKAPLDADREIAFARGFEEATSTADFHHINITALTRATLNAFKPSKAASTTDVADAFSQGHKIAVVKVDDAALHINSPLALDLARRHSKDTL